MGLPESGRSTGGASVGSLRQPLEIPQNGDGQGHGGWLAALADQVQHPVPTQRLAVVPDRHRCGFGGAQGG